LSDPISQKAEFLSKSNVGKVEQGRMAKIDSLKGIRWGKIN
jgi:hypothetical protein